MARVLVLFFVLAAIPAASSLNVDNDDIYNNIVPDFRGMSEDEAYIAQELWRTAQETEKSRKVLLLTPLFLRRPSVTNRVAGICNIFCRVSEDL
ncbi:hypothetical protein CSUI_006611 [Cystoisospora suis]|uniref:Uncharacterized protein n=1 Tax=Cystoisospora suis TaxID=483139 RepID=A0A2C6KGD3_9APIC|nr:hypothetical protein CSUI_006611 [Cystoisospora suis]